MKKLILSVTAVAGFSVGAFAQGTIVFDGHSNTSSSPTATSGGKVFISGVLDTSTDINAELLYSSTATGTFSPVATLLLSSSASPSGHGVGQVYTAASDVVGDGDGTFSDQSGTTFQIPNIAGGTVAYFEVEAWLGSYSSLAAAQQANQASVTTAAFAETLSTSSSPSQQTLDQLPALNLTAVPEPSTLAMAGVGLASMLIFRRKNS